MTAKKLFALFPGLALGAALLLSCANPVGGVLPAPEQGSTGALLVHIGSVAAKILLPPLDMDIASYTLSGSGPAGGSFTRSTATSPLEIAELAYGTWEVSVEGLNADGILVGRGQGKAEILAGQTASLSVTVTPLSGFGTLSLSVLWTASELQNPAVAAQLVPASGSAMPLTFSVSPGQATYSGAVPTGYFTLSLQLLEGSMPVMGAIEIARIVKDQTTSGEFQFYDLNLPGGGIDVDITPQPNDPLEVTLSGQLDSLQAGQSMTVSAAAPAGSGELIWSWYLNGAYQASGASVTLGSGLAAGAYRLDVTVFTADGTRAGSASHSFSVAEAQAAQATLLWDANSEADLAGYRLYYGWSSGSYDSVVDVGNLTSYTLTGLEAGRTYYIIAKAYDTAGLESEPSNEVSLQL